MPFFYIFEKKYITMKNFRIITGLTFVFALLVAVSSCGKYEEGPAISLRSKKARVANDWIVEKTIDEDGNEDTDGMEGVTYTFTKEGIVTITYDGSSTGGFSGSISGTWSFTDDKEGLIMESSFFGTTTQDTSKILKLKNDEMWLEDEEEGTEIHFKSK